LIYIVIWQEPVKYAYDFVLLGKEKTVLLVVIDRKVGRYYRKKMDVEKN
jgi:hypothetical protein